MNNTLKSAVYKNDNAIEQILKTKY